MQNESDTDGLAKERGRARECHRVVARGEEDEPEFKYVSTMHGNEPVGTEMCLYFVDLLLTDYGSDPRITSLVDENV